MNFDEFNAILGILSLLASMDVPVYVLVIVLWIYIVAMQFESNRDN